jgi:hypothetical protein
VIGLYVLCRQMAAEPELTSAKMVGAGTGGQAARPGPVRGQHEKYDI